MAPETLAGHVQATGSPMGRGEPDLAQRSANCGSAGQRRSFRRVWTRRWRGQIGDAVIAVVEEIVVRQAERRSAERLIAD